MVSLIYARSENYCIGRNGGLPWHLPLDTQFFHTTTMGHTVIMGRRTYEDHQSLLEGRNNILVTSNPDYRPAAGVEIVLSLDAAIAEAAAQEGEIFIIGGVSMFEAAFPQAQTVYETIVNTFVDGDVFIPAFDFSSFSTRLVLRKEADADHGIGFSIYLHTRTHQNTPEHE